MFFKARNSNWPAHHAQKYYLWLKKKFSRYFNFPNSKFWAGGGGVHCTVGNTYNNNLLYEIKL